MQLQVWQTEWSTFDPVNFNWYATGSRSEGLSWANNAYHTIAVANVSSMMYWWGAANTTVSHIILIPTLHTKEPLQDNQSLLIVNNTNTVEVTKRLWAFAHYGSRLVLPGAYRIDATSSIPTLNVTAFSNPDGTTAVQVINNGNTTQSVTVRGITVPNVANAVSTFLTNQAVDFQQGVPISQDKNLVTASVPAKSLLSFKVMARKGASGEVLLD
jgi:hypothetical protein